MHTKKQPLFIYLYHTLHQDEEVEREHHKRRRRRRENRFEQTISGSNLMSLAKGLNEYYYNDVKRCWCR